MEQTTVEHEALRIAAETIFELQAMVDTLKRDVALLVQQLGGEATISAYDAVEVDTKKLDNGVEVDEGAMTVTFRYPAGDADVTEAGAG